MNDSEKRPEMLRADATHRRWALFLVVVLGCLGFFAIRYVEHRLRDIERVGEKNLPDAIDQAVQLIDVVAWTGGVGGAGLAIWLFVIAWRVKRAEQFPPPGMKVIRDTPLRTGQAAYKVANAMVAMAFLLLILGTIGMWYLHRLAIGILR